MFNFAQKELYPQKHWLCNFLNSSCQHGQASFAAETSDAIITTSIISTSDRVLFLSVDFKIFYKTVPFAGWKEKRSDPASEGATGRGGVESPASGDSQHPKLGCRDGQASQC